MGVALWWVLGAAAVLTWLVAVAQAMLDGNEAATTWAVRVVWAGLLLVAVFAWAWTAVRIIKAF